MLEIEKSDKQELFSMARSPEESSELRQRGSGRGDRTSLLSQHESVTEKMLSITRHLSETTQKSAATLEQLVRIVWFIK